MCRRGRAPSPPGRSDGLMTGLSVPAGCARCGGSISGQTSSRPPRAAQHTMRRRRRPSCRRVASSAAIPWRGAREQSSASESGTLAWRPICRSPIHRCLGRPCSLHARLKRADARVDHVVAPRPPQAAAEPGAYVLHRIPHPSRAAPVERSGAPTQATHQSAQKLGVKACRFGSSPFDPRARACAHWERAHWCRRASPLGRPP